MFTDAQGRKWRHRITKRDGTIRYADSGVLQDGERLHTDMFISDGASRVGSRFMADAAVNDAYLSDARKRLEDTYGVGAGCLATFSDGAKARSIIDAALSNEVYRVEQAADAAIGVVRRTQIDPRTVGGPMRDSDETRTAVAAFMTRVADDARGRAAALRAGYQAPPEDPRGARRLRDAAQAGPAAAAHAEMSDRLSNAWRNR